MTESHEEPIIRDNRKIDPETGKARPGASEAPGAPGAQPDAATPAQPTDASASSASAPSAASSDEALADLKAENARLADELARANAATYNVNQEYAAYVRRAKDNAVAAQQAGVEKVGEALLSVLDDIDLARQHGDLTGPFKSVAEKLENTLGLTFKLERFGEVGQEFDPAEHEALMDQPSEDVTVATIAQVVQPGYHIGDKILRPARVVVNSPA